MRTVLFAAASTLCLAFAAHSAPSAHRHAAHQAADTDAAPSQPAQPLSATMPAGSTCIDGGASLSHAAYSTDDDADCCGSSGQYCSQFLSTQALVQPPVIGHT